MLKADTICRDPYGNELSAEECKKIMRKKWQESFQPKDSQEKRKDVPEEHEKQPEPLPETQTPTYKESPESVYRTSAKPAAVTVFISE